MEDEQIRKREAICAAVYLLRKEILCHCNGGSCCLGTLHEMCKEWAETPEAREQRERAEANRQEEIRIARETLGDD